MTSDRNAVQPGLTRFRHLIFHSSPQLSNSSSGTGISTFFHGFNRYANNQPPRRKHTRRKSETDFLRHNYRGIKPAGGIENSTLVVFFHTPNKIPFSRERSTCPGKRRSRGSFSNQNANTAILAFSPRGIGVVRKYPAIIPGGRLFRTGFS